MSARPGMRNFLVASRTFAPRGTVVEIDGPSEATCPSAMRTVISGRGAAPVASMTVTWVIAKAGVRGVEHDQSKLLAAMRRNSLAASSCFIRPASGIQPVVFLEHFTQLRV